MHAYVEWEDRYVGTNFYYFSRVPHKTVGNRSQASASEGLYVAGGQACERARCDWRDSREWIIEMKLTCGS